MLTFEFLLNIHHFNLKNVAILMKKRCFVIIEFRFSESLKIVSPV